MRFALAVIAALTLATPAAAADWWVAETDHFIVKSRDSEKATREFAQQLERFDGAMRTLQNMPLDEKPGNASKLTVYRFGDPGEIGSQLGSSSVAGFFIPRAGNSVAFVPAREEKRDASSIHWRQSANAMDAVNILQHEYTHYFMMQHFPAAYPSWYVEGYAEVMGTLRLNDDGSFHIGDPPQHRAYQVLEMRQFPLKEMLDANHELSGMDYIQFYGTGWLFAHYLNFEPQRLQKLNEYLRAIGTGEDSLAAAERIFGDLGKMQKELMRYRDGPYPGYDVKPANYTPPQVATRQLTAIEVAMLREEMRLNRGVEEEAKDVAADARRKSKGFENDYGAMLILARAELAAENFAEADAVAAKLAELDATRAEAWLIRSDAAIERIKDDPAQAANAREYSSKAAQLDREDPRPLINYYYSYVEAGEEAPERAVIALETAYGHAGSDAGYRMLLGRQLLSENAFDTAKQILMPVAFQGHATGEDDAKEGDPTPRRLLAAIDNKDAAAAIAIIDKFLDDEDEDEEKGG